MKTIFTKYLPCTNTKPSRLKAWDMDGNQIVVDYPHHLPASARYWCPAFALCKKMGWEGELVMGVHKDVNCFTFIHESYYNVRTIPEYEPTRKTDVISSAG